MKLKVVTVGQSLAVSLPKAMVTRLRLAKGDVLYAHETPHGLVLSAYDPELATQMDVAEEILHEDREALRELTRQTDA